MQFKFDIPEAMNVLRTVCGKYLGTAQDHAYLQFVLNEIQNRLEKTQPTLEVVKDEQDARNE
jgi:hypothetical protein